MAKPDAVKHGFALTTARIQALTDSIFAFAMTLLVLNLTLPDALARLPNVKLYDLLIGQAGFFQRWYNYRYWRQVTCPLGENHSIRMEIF